ncbi:MAG: aldo/keto reductase [Armatimonadota bacterium]|nr:MAG: aldo/keto reductase [Armatimonadota bacterium]
MKTRVLGRTGLQVSELGLGGLFISRVGGKPQEESVRAIRRALELGVNYIDTAPTYADSEEVLGAALDGVEHSYIISTKLGGRPEPFDAKDKAALRESFATSLRLLRRDSVDILMVHEPDRPGQYDWWTDYDSFHGPVIEVLQELKGEGIIRFTGLGGTTAYELPRIMATGFYDVVLTAFNYSLLWREAAIAVLPEAKKQDMGLIIGSPLQQGALARRYDDEVSHGAPWLSPPRRAQYRALYAFLDELGLPLAEVALRFCLSHPDVATVLMGARSVEEVEQNVAAVEKGPLPPEVLKRLDEIAAMVPFRPFEEPFGLPFGREHHGPGRAR